MASTRPGRHRRPALRPLSAATILLAALALLTGCVRADADLAVDGRSNTVSGTIRILLPLTEDTPEARDTASQRVLELENRVLPGLRTTRGVTAAAAEEGASFGTELTLEGVALANLHLGPEQLITRSGNTFVVAGVLDTTGQPGVPVAEAEGGRPPGAADSVIRIALTFPGAVIDTDGSTRGTAQVDGTSVTWESSWDKPLELGASANATTASVPEWIWKGLAWGIGAVAVLAVAGLLTVWVRSRHD